MYGEYDRDREHLKLLGIFYYVMAALSICGCLYGLMYVGMGGFFSTAMQQGPNAPPPEMAEGMGALFSIIGGVVALMSAVAVFCGAYAGYSLQNHKNRIFCIVIAALYLLSIPFGTILGVFTLIVLSRPTVIDLFEGREPQPQPDRFEDDLGAP